jgi:hypothetical protein
MAVSGLSASVSARDETAVTIDRDSRVASADLLAEAPPPHPRRTGLVVESTAGLLGFTGKFRHVAPPGYWMHTQLGYELTSWLMLFGEGELSFTDTSGAQGLSSARSFPMWGVGGGGRLTVHPGERIGAFIQAEVGGLAADVPHGALANLGFRSAETLGLQAGGRVGVEWFPGDPHLALCAQSGGRYARGFSREGGGDLPLMWDAAVGLRYAF